MHKYLETFGIINYVEILNSEHKEFNENYSKKIDYHVNFIQQLQTGCILKFNYTKLFLSSVCEKRFNLLNYKNDF